MVAKGYFAHDSLSGSPFWNRLEGYYTSKGFATGRWARICSGQLNPGNASSGSAEAWMHSPEHRANILSPAWREIGIAAVSVPSAPGTFEGLDVTVITTDFGVRR